MRAFVFPMYAIQHIGLIFLASLVCVATLGAEVKRPNILYIALEDIAPMMGCYGDSYAKTPADTSIHLTPGLFFSLLLIRSSLDMYKWW